MNLGILTISDDPAIDGEQKVWARRVGRRLFRTQPGGAYVNYMSEEEDVHSAYSDARLQRLGVIKAQYDPANLFRFNQNIPPAKG